MSISKILIILALLAFITLVHSVPSRRQSWFQRGDTICGYGDRAGILMPVNGSTLTVSVEDQDNYEFTIEVIHCSDAYFKTSTINVTTWLSYAWNLRYGELLASGIQPDPTVADAGFGGYRFNVTFNPSDDGSWDLEDMRTLFVQEFQTGYYYDYGVEIWSVDFYLALATATATTSSSTSVDTLSIDCSLYPFLCSSTSGTTYEPTTEASTSMLTSKTTATQPGTRSGTLLTKTRASRASTSHLSLHTSTSVSVPRSTPPPYQTPHSYTYPSYVDMSPGLLTIRV